MLTTAEVPLGDGMIYNRQMLGFERVMSEALADVLEVSDIVLFPAVDDNAYYFDGMAHVGEIEGDFRVDFEYWDPGSKRRYLGARNGFKQYAIYQITKKINWDILEKEVNGEANYFFLPGVGEELFREIEKRFDVVRVERYSYKGWRLYNASIIMTYDNSRNS